MYKIGVKGQYCMQKGEIYMRKRYSIGFLLFLILIVVLFIIVYRFSYHRALVKMEEEILEELAEDIEECYYIKGTDGYVTVYLSDGETVYEYTSISMDELPTKVQEELQDGKKVKSIRQVYGFLENYSS